MKPRQLSAIVHTVFPMFSIDGWLFYWLKQRKYFSVDPTDTKKAMLQVISLCEAGYHYTASPGDKKSWAIEHYITLQMLGAHEHGAKDTYKYANAGVTVYLQTKYIFIGCFSVSM